MPMACSAAFNTFAGIVQIVLSLIPSHFETDGGSCINDSNTTILIPSRSSNYTWWVQGEKCLFVIFYSSACSFYASFSRGSH